MFLKLNKISQDWADELAKNDIASHRPNNVYGENIYKIRSTQKITELGVRAVDSWYNEIKFFNFQGTNKDMAASTKACKYDIILVINYIEDISRTEYAYNLSL